MTLIISILSLNFRECAVVTSMAENFVAMFYGSMWNCEIIFIAGSFGCSILFYRHRYLPKSCVTWLQGRSSFLGFHFIPDCCIPCPCVIIDIVMKNFHFILFFLLRLLVLGYVCK